MESNHTKTDDELLIEYLSNLIRDDVDHGYFLEDLLENIKKRIKTGIIKENDILKEERDSILKEANLKIKTSHAAILRIIFKHIQDMRDKALYVEIAELETELNDYLDLNRKFEVLR